MDPESLKGASANGLGKFHMVLESLFSFRPRLSNRISNSVENDDAVGLQGALEEERKKLGLSFTGGKQVGNKRNKRNKGATAKEDDPFTILLRHVLQYACICDSRDCASLLVSGEEEFLQVQVDAIDDGDGRTPLHHAALHHSSGCIEVLLRCGANTGLRSKAGFCPLEEALQSPKIKVDWGPETPAGHIVARLREKELTAARLLGEKSKDQLVRVAFRLASEVQLVPLVALLLVTRGSFVNTVARGADYTGCDEEGSGTLVDLLVGKALKAGSAIQSKTRPKQMSALGGGGWGLEEESSIFDPTVEMDVKMRTEVMRMLEAVLIFNPRLSAHPQSSEVSPFLRAAQANDGTLVGLLLDANAAVNETDADGNTALHWALRQATPGNRREVDNRLVKRLLDAGANVLHGNKLGATPVHTAAGHGHVEALRMILEKEPSGSNVMAATKETPLHYAVKNNHLECADVLLQCGANRHVVSLRNQRPGQLAPSPEMRALLQEPEPSLANALLDPHKAAWEAASFSSHLQPIAGAPSLWSRGPGDESDPNRSIHHAAHPNLPAYRTAMCRFHLSPEGCSYGPKCHFAHTEEELRAYGGTEHTVRSSGLPIVPGDAADIQAKAYKTKICQHYEKGLCPHGSKCKFAHGEAELRAFPGVGRVAGRPSTASSLASSASDDEEYNARKVFVGGLPHFIKSEDLWEHFEEEFGRVRDAVVICGLDEEGSQRSRGFGFVLFEDPNDAYEAVRRHWVPFRGRRVEVKRAQAQGAFPSEPDSHSSASSSMPPVPPSGSERMPSTTGQRPTPVSVSSSALSSPQAPLSPALSLRSFRGEDTVALFNDGVQLTAGAPSGLSHSHGFGPSSSHTHNSHSHSHQSAHALHAQYQQSHHHPGGVGGAPPPGWSLPPLSVPSQAVQAANAAAATAAAAAGSAAAPIAPPPHSFLPPAHQSNRASLPSLASFGQPGAFQNPSFQSYLDSSANGLFSHTYSSTQVPAGASLSPTAHPAGPQAQAEGREHFRRYRTDSGATNDALSQQRNTAQGTYFPSQQLYSLAGNPSLSAAGPSPGNYSFDPADRGRLSSSQAAPSGDDDDISELLAMLNTGTNGLGSTTFSNAAGAAGNSALELMYDNSQQPYSKDGDGTSIDGYAKGGRNSSNSSIYHLPNLNEFMSG